jgi:hopene-associated glycosyltransferase HpnB
MAWLSVAAALSLAAWIYLLLGRRFFWLTRERLPADLPTPPLWPEIAVLIPARDEAATIAATIAGLCGQDYPGRVSVTLIDDSSSDGTAGIARESAPGENLQIIAAPPLQEGWTGKIWALHNGLAHIDRAAPNAAYVLLTDADIAHPPDLLRRLVALAESHRRDLVSLMVKLNCATLWERLLIPAFVYFFRKLYPFAAVNDDRSRAAAAAGGCVLVRRDALTRIGGFAALRGALIDDCTLAAAIKAKGGSLWLGLADSSLSLRVYEKLADIWAMVARSAYAQLRHSPLLLLGTVIGLAIIYLAPPLIALLYPLHSDSASALLAGSGWLAMTLSFVPILAYYRLSWPWALTLPVAALLYIAMTVDSARRHFKGAGGAWKGRHYAA